MARRRLPNLTQLRAFEAAAHCGSFKAAAEDLHVTQGAISQQIKALEQDLGRPLFERTAREVRLTPEARPLADAASKAFDGIAEAVAAFGGSPAGPLLLSVAPFYANRWLLPRLHAFRARHPDIAVETMVSLETVDLEAGEIDAALRYGAGDWPGLRARLVHRDVVGPVVAPSAVRDRRLPLSPEEIARLPLIGARRWPREWAQWFGAQGYDGPLPQIDLQETKPAGFDMALAGRGVVLADHRQTREPEQDGALVRLHPGLLELPYGIHLVSPDRMPPDPRLEVLFDWLSGLTDDQAPDRRR